MGIIVDVIILNYKNWKDTLVCLESLTRLKGNCRIIVVDNYSNDDSTVKIDEWCRKDVDIITSINQPFKRKLLNNSKKKFNYSIIESKEIQDFKFVNKSNEILFIKSDKNDGFAAGNNLGITVSLNNQSDYVWLLNNDTFAQDDSLEELLKFALNSNCGIVGSSLYYYDEINKIQALGGTVNSFFGTTRFIKDKRELNRLDYVIGASFLIKVDCIKNIGGLCEEYFLYYEEVDYCYKAKKCGYKIGTALKSIVFHKEGGAIGSNSKDNNNKSEFSDILSLKNRVKFHKKHLGGGIGLYLGVFISLLVRLKRFQFKRILKFILNK